MTKIKMTDIITFGKFKGNTWENIFGTSNQSYLNWCRLTIGIKFPKKETNDLIRWAENERKHITEIKSNTGVNNESLVVQVYFFVILISSR